MDMIWKHIHTLKRTEQQLLAILTLRQEIEPAFILQSPLSYVLDENMKCMYISQSGARYLGRIPADIEGRYWQEIGLSAAGMQAVEHDVRTVFQQGKAMKRTLRLPLYEEALHYYEYTVAPLYKKDGQIGAVICTTWDTTTKTSTQSELLKYTRWFKELIQFSPFGVLLVDKEEKVLMYNDATVRLLPDNIKNIIGISLEKLLYELKYTQEMYHNNLIVKALKGFEAIAVHRKILDCDLLINCFPLKDNDGHIIGAVTL